MRTDLRDMLQEPYHGFVTLDLLSTHTLFDAGVISKRHLRGQAQSGTVLVLLGCSRPGIHTQDFSLRFVVPTAA